MFFEMVDGCWGRDFMKSGRSDKQNRHAGSGGGGNGRARGGRDGKSLQSSPSPFLCPDFERVAEAETGCFAGHGQPARMRQALGGILTYEVVADSVCFLTRNNMNKIQTSSIGILLSLVVLTQSPLRANDNIFPPQPAAQGVDNFDGQRFLMYSAPGANGSTERPNPLTVVFNWQAGLKK